VAVRPESMVSGLNGIGRLAAREEREGRSEWVRTGTTKKMGKRREESIKICFCKRVKKVSECKGMWEGGIYSSWAT
jgi:hypothetical protein